MGLAALGINRAHLIGHHTGACIACELAARHRDLAESVALVGPVPLTEEERTEFSRHFGTPFETTISGSYLMDNWHYLDRLGAHADLELFHREMWDMLRAQFGRAKSYAAVWDQDFSSHFRAIQSPLAIMCAKDDVLWPFFKGREKSGLMRARWYLQAQTSNQSWIRTPFRLVSGS